MMKVEIGISQDFGNQSYFSDGLSFPKITAESATSDLSEFTVPSHFLISSVLEQKEGQSLEQFKQHLESVKKKGMHKVIVGSRKNIEKSFFSKGRRVFKNEPFKIKIKAEDSFEIFMPGLDFLIPVYGKDFFNFDYIIENYNIYKGFVDGEFFFATQKGKIKLIDNYLLDLSIVKHIIT